MALKKVPSHLAIILDGNGRWAKKYKQPRSYGHYHGGRNLFKMAQASFDLGVQTLTVFAFSTENWKRPKDEIKYLMEKPIELFEKNKHRIDEIMYKVSFAGHRHRLSKELIDVMNEIEQKTQHFDQHHLIIAVDYGSKDELCHAFSKIDGDLSIEAIESNLMIKEPVDLLIRTSGEMRLSNFLLWQCAYAEFYFSKVHWPAFKKRHLIKAFKNYEKRCRRFGGIS